MCVSLSADLGRPIPRATSWRMWSSSAGMRTMHGECRMWSPQVQWHRKGLSKYCLPKFSSSCETHQHSYGSKNPQIQFCWLFGKWQSSEITGLCDQASAERSTTSGLQVLSVSGRTALTRGSDKKTPQPVCLSWLVNFEVKFWWTMKTSRRSHPFWYICEMQLHSIKKSMLINSLALCFLMTNYNLQPRRVTARLPIELIYETTPNPEGALWDQQQISLFPACVSNPMDSFRQNHFACNWVGAEPLLNLVALHASHLWNCGLLWHNSCLFGPSVTGIVSEGILDISSFVEFFQCPRNRAVYPVHHFSENL